MEEKVPKEESINLLEIGKLLLGKIKLLLLVVLIAAVMGGAFAVFKTYDVNYWGTELEFYVNPIESKENNSESQYGIYGAYGSHIMDTIVKTLSSENFAQIVLDEMEDVPDKYVLDEDGSEVLSEDYISMLRKVMESVSYSYLKNGESIDDVNNLAKSFIYVKISVLNNKDFAEALLQRVKKAVPAYVEEHMFKPQGYEGTSCTQLTIVDSIELTNPGYMTSQAVKYAALAGIAALAVACLVIILIDRSDNRLRDYESVMNDFGVPVLGVIPTIASLEEDVQNKAKEKAKLDKEAK